MKTVFTIANRMTLCCHHKEQVVPPRKQIGFLVYQVYSFKSKCAETHCDVHYPSQSCLRCSEMCTACHLSPPYACCPYPEWALVLRVMAPHCRDAIHHSTLAKTLHTVWAHSAYSDFHAYAPTCILSLPCMVSDSPP